MRALLIIVLGAGCVLPAWLLATEAGLRASLALAQRLTGEVVTVESAAGRLIGDVSLRGLTVATPATTVRVERAVLNLRLARLLIGRIQAETLDVQTLSIVVHEGDAAAPADDAPLTVAMPLRLAVEAGELRNLRLRLPGRSEDWVLPAARFGARWRDEWIVIGALHAETVEAGPVDVRGRIAIADGALRVRDFDLRGPGELHAEGALALGDTARSDLTLRWKALAAPAWIAGFDSPHGEGTLQGPWSGYTWTLRAHVHAADIAGDLDARGRGSLRGLAVQHAELRALDGAVHADGTIDWSKALRVTLSAQISGVDPGARFAAWPGRITGRVQARLHLRERGPWVEFDAQLADSRLRGYPFALQARGRTERDAVFLERFELQSGVSTVAARGQLWPRFGLAGQLRSADLASLWAGLAGRAEARAELLGTPAAPRLVLRGTVDGLRYGSHSARHVAIDAELAPAGRTDATLRAQDVRSAIALREMTLRATGTRAAHRLALDAMGDDGTAKAALTGRVMTDGWAGRLVEAQWSPANDVPWVLEEAAPIRLGRGRFAIQPACLRGADSRVCAAFAHAPGRQDVAFRLRALDLARLRAWLPAEWTIRGTLDGTASLRLRRGELAEIRADLAASAGAIIASGIDLAYGPGTLVVGPDEGRVRARLHVRPAGGEVEGEVWVAPGGPLLDRPMLGDLRVKLPDLAWLPVLSPEIAAAQGAIDADLHVSGTPRAPALDGRVQVADGRVQLSTPGIELTGITATFERGRDAPLHAHLEATSGGGTFALDGTLTTLQPRLAGTFTLKGENVQGFNTAEMRAWLSPDLTLALDGRHARLTGTVVVPRAEITPRDLNRGGVGPSSDQVIVREADGSEPRSALLVESEVGIELGDDVRFDGLGLKTQLTGAITTSDEPARPTFARGELRLVGGRYQAYGQDLQIETGRLLFAGGPVTNPAIDLVAVRQPREDIKVGLRARGSLEAPQFSLFSEPAMSQEEQLSWMVLGRPLATNMTSGQQNELSSAALALGLSGGDYLAQRLAPRLGIDEVTVGAKPGETADLARFTIGKYLSPKLFVSYGVGLFQPGHFFRLQYDLSRRFKLVGESGVQQGGDVLYTIER